MTTTKLPRLDNLKPGSFIVLDFAGRYERPAIFIGITGEGDDRDANFVSPDFDGRDTYSWSAYRYNGHWAFGSSAERLRLVEVLA